MNSFFAEKWQRVFFLFFLAFFLACQSGSPGRNDSRVGMEATDFVVSALEAEGPQRLSDHQGEVILLDFWGVNCPPCRRSLPEIAALHEEFDGAFTLISMNVDGPSHRLETRDFLDARDIDHDVLLDNGRASNTYNVSSIPMVVIIDQQWRIARVFRGYTSPELLRAALHEVINGEEIISTR